MWWFFESLRFEGMCLMPKLAFIGGVASLDHSSLCAAWVRQVRGHVSFTHRPVRSHRRALTDASEGDVLFLVVPVFRISDGDMAAFCEPIIAFTSNVNVLLTGQLKVSEKSRGFAVSWRFLYQKGSEEFVWSYGGNTWIPCPF